MVIPIRDSNFYKCNKQMKTSNDKSNLNDVKSKSEQNLHQTTDSKSLSSSPSLPTIKKLKSSSSSSTTSTSSSSLECRKIIGNLKEIRINTNHNHLRIVGNSNKIRIINNYGSLDIVGNSISLKIVNNFGHINCTGNNCKLYFGSESSSTDVNYTGNNGILKVINGLIVKRSDSLSSKNATETTKINSNKCYTSSSPSHSSFPSSTLNSTIDINVNLATRLVV